MKSKCVGKTIIICIIILVLAFSVSMPAQAGWKTLPAGKRYTTTKVKKGYYTRTWKKIKGKHYYFDKKGYVKTGWFKVSGKWYYANKKGQRVYTPDDLRLLSAITYLEAGNQPYNGKLAVANVVLNRVKDSRFPNTLEGVIYQKWQFTPAIGGAYSPLGRLVGSGKKIQAECVKAAKEAMAGKNNVKGYFFFCRGAGQLRIGDHNFRKAY